MNKAFKINFSGDEYNAHLMGKWILGIGMTDNYFGDTTKGDLSMKKHKHDALIRKWLDNYDTHVVISCFTKKWMVCEYPDWDEDMKYKVIPRKHMDVALAFYNYEVGVEYRNPKGGAWYRATTPKWLEHVDYRIKPKPQPKDGEWWMCELTEGIPVRKVAHFYHGGSWHWDDSKIVNDQRGIKPLYKMVRADD